MVLWRALGAGLFVALLFLPPAFANEEAALRSGRALMESLSAQSSHYPWVYEEQTLILSALGWRQEGLADGVRMVRKQRFYSRSEIDGTFRALLIIDYPAELQGVALLLQSDAAGGVQRWIYLPALSDELLVVNERQRGSPFFGSDFTLADLLPEATDRFDYRLLSLTADPEKALPADRFERVEALPRAANNPHPNFRLRRHYIDVAQKVIASTEYLNHQGEVAMRLSYHDLHALGVQKDGGWRGDMLLMENFAQGHQSLLKVDKRVFSESYVPASLFTHDWIVSQGGSGARSEKWLAESHYLQDAEAMLRRHLEGGAPPRVDARGQGDD
ncbi:MAG: outer membrane lipoprotein-sorting protein [Gammaproteobacteria bacterium]|nr:outer membrane lipoprotein-sorting protein [Gammaproteobacteria bacterium]